jgi:hypothetical protein
VTIPAGTTGAQIVLAGENTSTGTLTIAGSSTTCNL